MLFDVSVDVIISRIPQSRITTLRFKRIFAVNQLRIRFARLSASPLKQPSTWRESSEQLLLNHVGWEARKSPAVAGVFFLDYPFYRTYQSWTRRVP
jgi:hypothetical protein